jgi:hypothetical protein
VHEGSEPQPSAASDKRHGSTCPSSIQPLFRLSGRLTQHMKMEYMAIDVTGHAEVCVVAVMVQQRRAETDVESIR